LERESGCCRAVVKIPLTAEAKVAILREAAVLRQLESDGCTFAPQLLCVDRDKGIATQKFVEGRPAGRRFTPAIYKLLGSLLRPGGATSLATHAMPLAADLDAVDGKSTVRGALEDLHDETPLPSCWEHGDFAPWNIRRTVDGDCVLLDWEDARRDGLPLMDAFHFLHMQDFLFGSKPRLHAASIRELAATMHVPLRSTAKLEAAYLLRAWTQSVREGNSARAGYVQRALAMSGRKAA
jgi:Ser/Thr protein kinase RdoA (MazF antagonist)